MSAKPRCTRAVTMSKTPRDLKQRISRLSLLIVSGCAIITSTVGSAVFDLRERRAMMSAAARVSSGWWIGQPESGAHRSDRSG